MTVEEKYDFELMSSGSYSYIKDVSLNDQTWLNNINFEKLLNNRNYNSANLVALSYPRNHLYNYNKEDNDNKDIEKP